MNEGQAIASSGEEPPAYPVPNSPSNFPQAFEANLNAELRSPTSSLNSPAMPVNSNAHVQTVNRHHDDKNVAAAKKPAPILVSVGELFPAGLQVPSKHKSMASGFAFPPQLGRIGMDERAWSRFTHDICKIAKMDASQWRYTIRRAVGTHIVAGFMIGPVLAIVPAMMVGHVVKKKNEIGNFEAACDSGVLVDYLAHWNKVLFEPKGLMVRIEMPGNCGDMESMDVSTSKIFQERALYPKPMVNFVLPLESPQTNLNTTWVHTKSVDLHTSMDGKRQAKRRLEESRKRINAVQRGRIVIVPLTMEASDSLNVPISEKLDRGVAEVERDEAEIPLLEEPPVNNVAHLG